MKDPRRREFIRKSAGALAAMSAMGSLPSVILRALAAEPNSETGTIQDVKHVVILMQENRSFDHYFGTLQGVRGFGDRFPIPLESGKPVWYQSNGTDDMLPYHLDSQSSQALYVPDTPHSFADQQAAWNQGKFGEWPLYKTAYSMGYYKREEIPFQYALADAFTVCDSYHCSLTSSTVPNRVVFWSGSNFDPELGKAGTNCTDAAAEVNNLRGVVKGAMPNPGYSYTGSALTWPTLPELLQSAGVSWRIFQDPNDNWQGVMHGCLPFAGFRNATTEPDSPLYANGMSLWTLDDLRAQATNGTLPSVSWILPSQSESEHPASGSTPAKAADFTAQILDALTANTDTWSKTVFFVVFDENDGFFDHVPAPAVPSYNADGTLAGKSTVSLAGEYFSDPAGVYREPGDTISGSTRPWGLGARVPMYVISPWSKGGWVNSQVFDHTSMGMFLEKRFGISVDSISPWHRAISGDLTSVFNFAKPGDSSAPTLPDATNYAAIEAAQRALPLPIPPSTPEPLYQELGTRNSRALPYELHTSARVQSMGSVELLFSNTGTQGAVFHVYDQLHLDRIPRRYTVEAGKTLNDLWTPDANDAGAYNLWVYSTNGYIRTFAGNATTQPAASFQPEIQVCYDPRGGQIYLKVHNMGTQAGGVTVQRNAYAVDGPWAIPVAAHATGILSWDLSPHGNWYDFTVLSESFERRFAGRLETGNDSISDPAMGTGQ